MAEPMRVDDVDNTILKDAQTMRYTSPEWRKLIIEALAYKARTEKPQIDYPSIKKWVREKMPYWSNGKVEDYSHAVLSEIVRYLKEKKEKEVSKPEQTTKS